MAILIHGTTRHRAEQIAVHGPDPDFIEPDPNNPDPNHKEGRHGLRAESFSTYVEHGPFPLEPPQKYACDKAALFPAERGPAILSVNVPDDIIALAVDAYFPLSQGLVQFDEGAGLEELRGAWSNLWKEIRSVEFP